MDIAVHNQPELFGGRVHNLIEFIPYEIFMRLAMASGNISLERPIHNLHDGFSPGTALETSERFDRECCGTITGCHETSSSFVPFGGALLELRDSSQEFNLGVCGKAYFDLFADHYTAFDAQTK
jgi:hypothetical protein